MKTLCTAIDHRCEYCTSHIDHGLMMIDHSTKYNWGAFENHAESLRDGCYCGNKIYITVLMMWVCNCVMCMAWCIQEGLAASCTSFSGLYLVLPGYHAIYLLINHAAALLLSDWYATALSWYCPLMWSWGHLHHCVQGTPLCQLCFVWSSWGWVFPRLVGNCPPTFRPWETGWLTTCEGYIPPLCTGNSYVSIMNYSLHG